MFGIYASLIYLKILMSSPCLQLLSGGSHNERFGILSVVGHALGNLAVLGHWRNALKIYLSGLSGPLKSFKAPLGPKKMFECLSREPCE